jgi:hypothetical protein
MTFVVQMLAHTPPYVLAGRQVAADASAIGLDDADCSGPLYSHGPIPTGPAAIR